VQIEMDMKLATNQTGNSVGFINRNKHMYEQRGEENIVYFRVYGNRFNLPQK